MGQRLPDSHLVVDELAHFEFIMTLRDQLVIGRAHL